MMESMAEELRNDADWIDANLPNYDNSDLCRRAADRITILEAALQNIVDDTHVGKRGSCVLRSKYGNYAAKYYHAAVAVLREG